jgi:hypothetical protein
MGKNVLAPPTRLSRLPASLSAHAATPTAGDARFMFFLLRMAFWLGLVLVLLPSGAAQHTPSNNEVTASEAISAASATVGDLRGFCSRQPDACTVGWQMATALGYKAQAGAKMLYDVLSEALAPHETGSVASGASHGIVAKAPSEKSAVEPTSQNTLTRADLAPAWRGPPRRDGKPSA